MPDEIKPAKLGRRQFLQAGALAAAGAATTGGVARASHVPPRRRGPEDGHVYRNYTQAEIDRAYDQSFWAPNRAAVLAETARDSAEVRASQTHFEASYGPSPDETLDVYPTTAANAPIHVFVHGGAWRSGTKENSAYPAPTFVDAGAHYVALNFSLLPAVRLPEVVAQLRRAIRWVHGNAASFGGDADRIFVSGHSSGGHLAGVLLTTDWRQEGLPRDVLKGVISISGMFDLAPVMISSRRSYVVLSRREQRDLSAIRHIGRIECPVLLAYGGNESPEFRRQTRAFSAALEDARHPSAVLVMPDKNHFEIPRELKPGGLLAKAALIQMGLGGEIS